jgi:hypothetical protein
MQTSSEQSKGLGGLFLGLNTPSDSHDGEAHGHDLAAAEHDWKLLALERFRVHWSC